MEKQKPIHVIRFGRIKATIWANENASGIWHSVKLSRIYKDGDEWRQTDSFGRDDLLLACKALDQAHTWIYQQAEAGGANGNANPAAFKRAEENVAPQR